MKRCGCYGQVKAFVMDRLTDRQMRFYVLFKVRENKQKLCEKYLCNELYNIFMVFKIKILILHYCFIDMQAQLNSIGFSSNLIIIYCKHN